MPCKIVGNAIVCGPKVYEYDGWLFEVHSYCGPWPLRKSDYEPRENAGKRFWDMVSKWEKLQNREDYRVQ